MLSKTLYQKKFLEHLTDAIEVINSVDPDGWCPIEQGISLFELAYQNEDNSLIVELGSYMGLSTSWIGFGSRFGNNSKVVSVDLADTGYAVKKRARPNQTLHSNLERMGLNDICLITGKSSEVGNHFHAYSSEYGLDTTRVGMIYIDASHEEFDVRADFLAWQRWLTESAVVIFDDYTEDHPGVIKVVDELLDNGSIELGQKIGHAYFARINAKR